MLIDLFLLSLAVAGIAVLWRNLQESATWIRNSLNKLPKILSKSLTCGSCFTYWLSLGAVILFNPLKDWVLPVRFNFSNQCIETMHFLLSWFALAMVSVFIRFLYASIQELVNYQTHTLRKDHHVH